jgi:hypothetical protein
VQGAPFPLPALRPAEALRPAAAPRAAAPGGAAVGQGERAGWGLGTSGPARSLPAPAPPLGLGPICEKKVGSKTRSRLCSQTRSLTSRSC